ncbi:hypothetical protein EFV37_22115 [Mesorhizobium loti]|uniref:Uncharacterized protein n=1 Tax=Mesorhizobium jarvisii TaxID=1777867 RepID=A0A6M7TIQ2_9HYPH|nr:MULTISPECIES: hypothetical protein [Mesorhizobium]OBQ59581.1 hypothetical protein A9K72_25555 [Mesorhizobium loti]QKC64680.1 hypothetical protein EB229_22110 [Mesorhizobium jarvisii]QKD10594.1 hypothetical protein EFV37_22115 [Mesorhizobium loti]RJT30584.1 hypothetical protein D3242_24745 [Mesorhizobium jarvisii]
MSALPQDPHAGLEIAVRVEANEHRHALAGGVEAPDAGDDEVSFGHGKKRQLRDADQPAHVVGGRRRYRQRHFDAPPAVPPEVHHGHALIAAIDADRVDMLTVARLGQQQPPPTRTCAREGERGNARRR